MHLLLIPTFPAFSRGPVLLPSAGEGRGEVVGGPPLAGQRATVALSVLLVWPEQPSR